MLHISEAMETRGARSRKKKKMEAAIPDLSDFEFFLPIYQNFREKLRLPDKFAEVLECREPREVKLRESSGGRRLWVVDVVFDGDGHMYLGRGWEQFARVHDLQLGHFLVLTYDGDAVLIVKVFDGTMCCRHYHDDDVDASRTPAPRSLQLLPIKEEEESCVSPGSESSADSGGTNGIASDSKNSIESGGKSSSSEEMHIDEAPASQFTVMLRQCNLGEKQHQYLNVPPEFQNAHGYEERTKVVLRMRGGKSWPVNLKHNVRAGGKTKTRTSLRYGWHQFCVDNRLGVGDTCFFRALRGSGGEDHELKVEVRRRDGTFAD